MTNLGFHIHFLFGCEFGRHIEFGVFLYFWRTWKYDRDTKDVSNRCKLHYLDCHKSLIIWLFLLHANGYCLILNL